MNRKAVSPRRRSAPRIGILRAAVAAGVILASVGAARAWAEDAAILTAPKTLYAGGKSSFTVTTFDAATRSSIARAVTVELTDANGTQLAVLYSGSTGSGGRRSASFDVPALPSGTYKVRASVTGLGEALEVSSTVSRAPGILIETDKPIYKPSQRIQGRVILLDNGLRPLAGQIELTIHDAKGIRVDRKTLTTDEFGAGAFSLDLAREVNYGVWKIRAKSEGAESSRDVRVEEYVLPRFELKAELSKSWALVDEEIRGAIEARYFFGKAVEGTAKVTARRWVGEWQEYATATGELAAGRLPFQLPPVGFVAGTPGESGQGTVTLDVSVVDSTGHEQTATEVVTITEAPVVLALVARTNSLKAGIAAEVLVSTKAPDDAVLDTAVQTTTIYRNTNGASLGNVQATVNTTAGRGTLVLLPPDDVAYAEVSASASLEGHTTTAALTVGAAYSPSGSFLSLARDDSDAPASVGQVAAFSTVSTSSGTVYYEVYAGGRTVLSDAAETGDFAFTVTPEMAPRAKVVAYQIQPNNEVAADSVALDVKPAVTVSMAASFSEDVASPGAPIQVTLDSGLGRRTLLGLSVVDKSVLALGQSRLHLGDVFAELERRFLEPQVEVHEGEGGPIGPGGPPPIDGVAGPAIDGAFWGAPRTRGALDTLSESGLAIAASKNVTVPQGSVIDWWRFAEDGVGPAPPAAGGEVNGPSGAPDVVRVRQYFPETWVWEPLRLTDEAGRLTLDLTTPDNITGWKLAVVGTAPVASGAGIVFGEADLTVFQDFFVEPSLPYSVVRGEVFPVKVDVFNYLSEDQTVELSLEGSPGFEITGGSTVQAAVPADSASAVHFEIRPTSLGSFPLKITARGSRLSDAVERQILIVPEGRPVESIVNSVIEPGTSAPLDTSIPPDAVSGSVRALLNITPSPVAQTLSGVSDLLGMPYGCGEQNMIFLAPDVEILKYLREVGELAPEVRADAEYYVNVGYQRELTFATDDGGFAAFGGEHGSLWLTAFVLSTFAGARDVRDIDEAVLARAASMLVSRQAADGSFQTDDFLIHQEMDGGLSNVYAMAAYVTNALADYALQPPGAPSADVATAIDRAAGYLEDRRSTVNDDAYSLSIAAVALSKVPGKSSVANAVLDRLLQLAKSDGPGLHWEPYPVETTGYAAMALLAADGGVGRPEAASAVEWLSTQRNSLGGYGDSTQDTVVAIRALFQAARKVRRDLDVDLSVVSGGTTLFAAHIDVSNYDVSKTFELPLETPLELRSAGSGNVGYQLVKRYNVPGDLLPPPRDMTIEVDYDAAHVEVDDIVDVSVVLEYTGEKARTGMVIADVGVPTGFEPLRASLDSLVDAGTLQRVEVAGRKVICYVDGLDTGKPLTFVFQVRALYPVRAEGPISRVYEYYDPSVEAYHRQGGVIIFSPHGSREFIRGDANGDGEINLADAVTSLGYLFLGAVPAGGAFCEDSADANDDGTLNITDPIQVLGYLFLGGTAPAAPFPEKGLDATLDTLRC